MIYVENKRIYFLSYVSSREFFVHRKYHLRHTKLNPLNFTYKHCLGAFSKGNLTHNEGDTYYERISTFNFFVHSVTPNGVLWKGETSSCAMNPDVCLFRSRCSFFLSRKVSEEEKRIFMQITFVCGEIIRSCISAELPARANEEAAVSIRSLRFVFTKNPKIPAGNLRKDVGGYCRHNIYLKRIYSWKGIKLSTSWYQAGQKVMRTLSLIVSLKCVQSRKISNKSLPRSPSIVPTNKQHEIRTC